MDLFELLKSFFTNFLYDFLKWVYSKTLNNPNSSLYHKKLVEKLKILWLAVKVFVILSIAKRMASSGMFRSASKDLELKIALTVLFIGVAIAVVTIYGEANKKENKLI